jgi:alkylhydroperoxidase family enzyme
MRAPRVAPLPREKWTGEVEAALRAGVPDEIGDRFMSDGPDAMRVPNGISSLMHHPRLAGRFLAFNALLLRDQVLDDRLRELMVLRVAWRTRSQYEWVQHARLAKRYGVTAAEIEAIADGAEGGAWAPLEADLLRATDQLLEGYRVDDDTWSRLASELDETALTEMLYVVGTYTLLAMVFNGLGVELDPDLDPTPFPPLPSEGTPR